MALPGTGESSYIDWLELAQKASASLTPTVPVRMEGLELVLVLWEDDSRLRLVPCSEVVLLARS